MRPAEVFLSHATADRPFAERLLDAIQGHGVRVWYGPTGIDTAQQWIEAIGAALDRCDWMVVVLSPSAAESLWVPREVGYALNERRYKDRISTVQH